MEAAQGRAPCPRCGAVDVPPVVNPYAPQMPAPIAQAWGAMAPQPGGRAWGCPACRHENAAHYQFCLGCGAARGAGAHVEGRNAYEGNPAASRQRNTVVLVALIVGLVAVVASLGVTAMVLAR